MKKNQKIQKWSKISKISINLKKHLKKKSQILERKKIQKNNPINFSTLGLRDSTRALQSSPVLRKQIWKNLEF